MKFLRLLALAILLLTSNKQILLAQGVTTGSISGRILDAKNEPLIAANVIATHMPSGTMYGASTRADGRYTLPNLRVGGPYTVKVTYLGYKVEPKTGITIALGDNSTLNFLMLEESVSLGAVTITAQSDNSVINSNRTGAATNIQKEQIERLPTLSRSITDYSRLTPQASGTSGFGGRNNLYNNLSVDGSTFNNAFGLASLPGGQTNSTPISLDAIEQVQVSLSPFDVRQGNFTGAGINAITRSGTNDVQASVYGFVRDQRFVGKTVGDVAQNVNDFSQRQAGFRVGAPIIKNKLFIFMNAEVDRRTDPSGLFRAKLPTDPSPLPSNVSNVVAGDLDSLARFLKNKYNYDPGLYQGYNFPTESNKFLAKIDWNITSSTKLSVRWNYLKSFREIAPSNSGSTGGRQNSVNSMPFETANYTINNNLNSVIAELNTLIGNRASNNFSIGWTGFRDFRTSKSTPFPTVDIENGSGQTITTFGYEPFTAFNKLDQDIFQISDNFTLYRGKHTLTLGTANELFQSSNGFAPDYYGRYRFSTLSSFYNNANGVAGSSPSVYSLQYNATGSADFPFAKLRTLQLGAYVQDEFQASDRLKITAGVRVDVPIYLNDLQKNTLLDTMNFRNKEGVFNEKIDVSKFPNTQLLFSPRIGFNWDVKGDKSLQVRGGTGIFTGRIPFVWLSNQASNNGVLFGSISQTSGAINAFSDDVNKYVPTNPTLPAFVTINSTAPKFKFPQVWRSNLAVDIRLAGNWVVTLEGMYTKDINAIYHRNANLDTAIGKVSGDGRPRYAGTDAGVRRYDNVIAAIVLDNVNEGYQANLTAQIQKSFSNGFYASLAYNFGPSMDITSSQSAIANSAFQANQIVGDPNNPLLSVSAYQQLHRVIGALSYRKEYAKNFATSFSLFTEARSGDQFSYTYANDMNGDRIFGNDLMYVPANQNEIVLVTAANVGTVTDTRTPNEIWTQLNTYIEQDPYLSEHRGQYAARNAARTPNYFRTDVRLMQDFYLNVKGKRNTIQLSADVFNALNLVNAQWGIFREVNRAQLLSFEGYESTALTARPTFSFPLFNNAPLASSYRDNVGLASRWQLQVGVRYIFN